MLYGWKNERHGMGIRRRGTVHHTPAAQSTLYKIILGTLVSITITITTPYGASIFTPDLNA